MENCLSPALVDTHEQILHTLNTYERFVSQPAESSTLIENVLVLARRLSMTSMPPTFIRFGTESGPLEPLPDRFRIPFPTIEDMRFSILNVKAPLAFSRPAANSISHPKDEKEDEYADDF